MRKFSNKSKKEKKNAIRRKTKDNRRNNKRRTYRKKMKGGDASDTVKSYLTSLEIIIEEVTDIINKVKTNITNNSTNTNYNTNAASALEKDLLDHNTELKKLNDDFKNKVEYLALKGKSETCSLSWNRKKCKENKKTHYNNVHKKLTEFNKILTSERQFITDVNKIKLSEQEDRLVNGFDLQLNQTMTIIKDNIKTIEEKATSRSADEEKATSRSATFGAEVEMTMVNPLYA